MDSSMPSLADIAAVTRENEGGFGGGWLWIIALFLIVGAFGGNGFGFGGGRDAATVADLERGFYNQTNEQMIRDVGNGIANLGYAINDRMADLGAAVRDGNYALNSGIMGVQYDLGSKIDSCCCTTQRAIDGVKFENAMGLAQVNANIDQKFAALEKQNLEQTIGAQAQRIQNLELQSALCGVVRYPVQATYSAGAPWFGGCGTQF